MSLLAESVSDSTPLQFLHPEDQDEPVQSEEDEFPMMCWLREPIQCSDADEQTTDYSIEEQNYDKDKSELVYCGY